MTTRPASSTEHRIGVVVFDGFKSLDASGPLEVFDEANQEGAAYSSLLLSPGGRTVRASNGMRVEADAAVEDPSISVNTIMIVGSDQLPLGVPDPSLVAAIARLAEKADRIASVCTGAFLLGAAGLLDGRRATTHWRHARRLQTSYPLIDVQADAIFVHDGNVHTSAGVTAGIDLSLALVESDHGGEVARRVAQSLVVYLQRAGGQSQFSPSVMTPRPTTSPLRGVFDSIAADPRGDMSIDALAQRAMMSSRHFSRLFHAETGMSPRVYIELVRLQTACTALEEGASVTSTVERAGFPSADALRRAFKTRLGVSPRQYQERFASRRHFLTPGR